MAHHEVAAGRERVPQGGHDAPGILRVRDEVQDGEEQQPGRLTEVNQPAAALVVAGAGASTVWFLSVLRKLGLRLRFALA